MDFKNFNVKQLLQLQASITNELRERGVVRTHNNPLGDYTEWLVSKALNLELAENSKAGFDAISASHSKIQIKGRRVTAKNPSRQLSAIRNLESNDFDELAVVIFDEAFNVLDAVIMPHAVISEYASYRQHTNAHVLNLRGSILKDQRVQSFQHQLEVAVSSETIDGTK
ncbi:DUF6998 domain-containing protein [Bacterioplanoides sp.]|uniref:DUF6998 domain-containing protein n=1 Tax=Bacterioplanoides sp. TaxID=2066072 RepID=UPI003AFFD716